MHRPLPTLHVATIEKGSALVAAMAEDGSLSTPCTSLLPCTVMINMFFPPLSSLILCLCFHNEPRSVVSSPLLLCPRHNRNIGPLRPTSRLGNTTTPSSHARTCPRACVAPDRGRAAHGRRTGARSNAGDAAGAGAAHSKGDTACGDERNHCQPATSCPGCIQASVRACCAYSVYVSERQGDSETVRGIPGVVTRVCSSPVPLPLTAH